MMTHPHATLVDAEGTPFDGQVTPVSGGNLRSELWMADFLLVPGNAGPLSNARDLAERQLGKRPADFRLLIENPDRRSGQAHRVEVKLQ